MNGHGRSGSRRDAATAPIVALAATVLVVGGMLAIGSGAPEPTLSASADRDAQLVVNASGPTTTAAPEAHDHGTSPGSAAESHDHATGAALEESHTHDASSSGSADHEHGAIATDAHADDPATTQADSNEHVHDTTTATDSSTPPDGHSHEPATAPADPTTPTTAHQHLPTGAIVSIDDPRLTAQQRNAAQSLLDSTVSGMQRFPNVDAVTAAGYEWIGDGARGGFRHYVNWSYLTDGRELDPSRIESVVAEVKPGGVLQVATAMYILEDGKTMSDVPDIAGELTTWHNHTNLCWVGHRLAGTLVNGSCQPGGELRVTPPMLHVWLTPQPCGPFSGLEGHGDDDCTHSH